MRHGHRSQAGQPPGSQPCFLGKLGTCQLLGCSVLSLRESARRERPAASAKRMPVLLDEVETVVLRRDDQGEVVAFDDRVGSPDPIGPLNLVPAQPRPVVAIDNAARQRSNLRFSSPSIHGTILPGLPDQWVTAAPRDGGSPGVPGVFLRSTIANVLRLCRWWCLASGCGLPNLPGADWGWLCPVLPV